MSTAIVTELESFQQFISEQLRNGGAALSPEECLRLWRARQEERAGANTGIRRGLAELEAGLGRPLDDFACDFRRRNGIRDEA